MAGGSVWGGRTTRALQRRLADGCHLTRDPVALVHEAGFTVTTLRQGYVGPANPWGYLTVAVATLP